MQITNATLESKVKIHVTATSLSDRLSFNTNFSNIVMEDIPIWREVCLTQKLLDFKYALWAKDQGQNT